MGELSEKQARACCEVVGIKPDSRVFKCGRATYLVAANCSKALREVSTPAWQAVQRAAAEAK